MVRSLSFAVVFCSLEGVVSECTNATIAVGKRISDVALDSEGTLWFTDSGGNQVMRCPEGEACVPFGKDWDWPEGIEVDFEGTVYVTAGDDHAPSVKKCARDGTCERFGSGWNSPRGITSDSDGNVYITNAYGDKYGVWKCTPSASCSLVGDSHSWPHYTPDCVAVDSQANVYVTGGYEDSGESNYVKKCTPAGSCSDFSGDWPKGGGYDNPIAVDADDNIYIGDSGSKTLLRCNSRNECTNLGNFEGGRDIVAASNGVFYAAGESGVRRICLPSAGAGIAV